MIQTKKAIGFFYGLGFLTFSYLFIKTIQIVSFSDFSLFEWQLKQTFQGSLQLPYPFIRTDPSLEFFPLPNLFFHLTNNRIDSTFPNLYPILLSPIFHFFGRVGLQITQLLLFFLSLWLFFQMKRDHFLTLLLMFGASIPIYTNLIHDTILIFFLEILLFYVLHKKLISIASFITVTLVWMRPEMVFLILLLPFYFEWETIWKKYIVWLLAIGICFVCINYSFFGTVLPLRIFKNGNFKWNLEICIYLLRLLLEQIPIFTLFLILSLYQWFQKQKSFHSLALLFITALIIILSPNTGGHNTPRYLYFLTPFYLFSIHQIVKNNLVKEWKWMITTLLISFYSIYQLNYHTKEIIKISKFQSNTLSALKEIPEQTLVFNNSDFSFVAIPLLDQNKNLILLRKSPEESRFSSFLTLNKINSFVFVELPPSPYEIPNPLLISNCSSNCKYTRIKTSALPNTMLPIIISTYHRNGDSETNF